MRMFWKQRRATVLMDALDTLNPVLYLGVPSWATQIPPQQEEKAPKDLLTVFELPMGNTQTTVSNS
jgi:hypothetical protein